jgi:hypothetical protein
MLLRLAGASEHTTVYPGKRRIAAAQQFLSRAQR